MLRQRAQGDDRQLGEEGANEPGVHEPAPGARIDHEEVRARWDDDVVAEHDRLVPQALEKYDDLPARFHKNVTQERPFGGAPGAKPALSKAEIRDVIAFLRTLTDADLEKNE